MLDQYLERLEVSTKPRKPTLDYLSQLQVAHMIAIPFENLDVCARRGVTTHLEHSLAKLIARRRGGWCFEVNGAFGWLLANLGFDVDYISCRVFGDGEWGPALDHCGLVVRLDDARWYVDVGFGDNCMVPIPIEDGRHEGVPRRVEVSVTADGFIIGEEQLDSVWESQLWCSSEALSLEAFTPRSQHLQTEPGLAWSEKPFATRALDSDGSRITLRPGIMKQRRGRGEFESSDVPSSDWPELLATHFGLLAESGIPPNP